VSAPGETSLKDALALMLVHDVRELTVVQDGAAAGVVSLDTIQRHVTGAG
jgi:CBS domain-containing protein